MPPVVHQPAGCTRALSPPLASTLVQCYKSLLFTMSTDTGFVRSIGRWAMTGLVINCIVVSGIFGLPGELNRLLGRASPIAMIAAGLLMASIMALAADVASQFSESCCAYLDSP